HGEHRRDRLGAGGRGRVQPAARAGRCALRAHRSVRGHIPRAVDGTDHVGDRMTTVKTRPPTTRGTPSATHGTPSATGPARGLQSTFAHHLTLSMKEHSHDL